MKRIIFTIYINIPDEELDNPAHYSAEGVQQVTDKSKKTKDQLTKYKDQLINRQQQYADILGVEYRVHQWDQTYTDFVEHFKKNYPQISHYDIICFYKHHIMLLLAEQYDQVCYFDLDIIPNTDESIFEVFDITNTFAVPDSNKEAEWGKTVHAKYYNTCIRNPSTKYWNAHAMLWEEGFEPDQHVYNTGIMIASSEIIKKLDYFGGFNDTIDLMTRLKNDPISMYPKNIQRVFNYDNETIFSYKLISNEVQSTLLSDMWHHAVDKVPHDPAAKMYHVINKKFQMFFE